MDYLPETPATAEKLILVSNCKQAARPADPVGKPSLEVTLENGYVYFRAQTPSDVIELRVPYKVSSFIENFMKTYSSQVKIKTTHFFPNVNFSL